MNLGSVNGRIGDKILNEDALKGYKYMQTHREVIINMYHTTGKHSYSKVPGIINFDSI